MLSSPQLAPGPNDGTTHHSLPCKWCSIGFTFRQFIFNFSMKQWDFLPLISQIRFRIRQKISLLRNFFLLNKVDVDWRVTKMGIFWESNVQDSAGSSWTLFRTALSQTKQNPGQRWIKLNTVQESAELWSVQGWVKLSAVLNLCWIKPSTVRDWLSVVLDC